MELKNVIGNKWKWIVDELIEIQYYYIPTTTTTTTTLIETSRKW